MAMFKVPVKGGSFLEVDSATINDDTVYNAIFLLGLKDALARGVDTKKIGKFKVGPDVTEEAAAGAKAKALEIAAKNLANLQAGKLPKMVGVKVSDGKTPAAVMTEAMRLGRNVIKDQIRVAGEKISHYEAKDITASAKALLAMDEGKELLVQAQKNVDERDAKKAALPSTSVADLQSKLGLNVSSKKVAEAEKAKAAKAKKGEALLSATQAGKTRQRKPAEATAH